MCVIGELGIQTPQGPGSHPEGEDRLTQQPPALAPAEHRRRGSVGDVLPELLTFKEKWKVELRRRQLLASKHWQLIQKR